MDGPRLLLLAPPPVREILLDQDLLTLGRRSTCDIALPGEDISRDHARLVKALGLYWLEDLGSTNGTYYTEPGGVEIRLEPREAQLLLTGGLIRLGRHVRLQVQGLPATRAEAVARIRAGLEQARDLSADLPGLSAAERERYLSTLRACLQRLDSAGAQDELHLSAAREVDELGQTLRGTLPGGLPQGDLPLPDLPDDLSGEQARAVRTVLNAFIRDLGECFENGRDDA